MPPVKFFCDSPSWQSRQISTLHLTWQDTLVCDCAIGKILFEKEVKKSGVLQWDLLKHKRVRHEARKAGLKASQRISADAFRLFWETKFRQTRKHVLGKFKFPPSSSFVSFVGCSRRIAISWRVSSVFVSSQLEPHVGGKTKFDFPRISFTRIVNTPYWLLGTLQM